jgi:hypothetical protein
VWGQQTEGRHDSLKATTTNKERQKKETKEDVECWNRSSDLDKQQKWQKGGSRQLPAFH